MYIVVAYLGGGFDLSRRNVFFLMNYNIQKLK